MTVRRRRSTGRTPAHIGSRLPVHLHQLPEVVPGGTSEMLVDVYRDYTDELQDAVWVETRSDDRGLVLAVAGALGTAPSDWFNAVFAAG